jgi:hypothetical protein
MVDSPDEGKGAFTLTVRNTVRGKFEPIEVEAGAHDSSTGDSSVKSDDPHNRGGSFLFEL